MAGRLGQENAEEWGATHASADGDIIGSKEAIAGEGDVQMQPLSSKQLASQVYPDPVSRPSRAWLCQHAPILRTILVPRKSPDKHNHSAY